MSISRERHALSVIGRHLLNTFSGWTVDDTTFPECQYFTASVNGVTFKYIPHQGLALISGTITKHLGFHDILQHGDSIGLLLLASYIQAYMILLSNPSSRLYASAVRNMSAVEDALLAVSAGIRV